MHILIRYGEIGVKSSPVRRKFEERLIDRLAEKLDYHGMDGSISKEEGRIFAVVDEAVAADAVLALSRTPGVVSVSPVRQTSLELEDIGQVAVDLMEERDVDSFAVDARRAGDHDYTSQEIEEDVGSAVQDRYDLAVDLDDPDVTVAIEARYTHAYLSTTVVDGVGGLPVSRESRVAVLMTDRAATVAAFLLMKRGCTVYPVYPGGDGEAVGEELALLRQYDPAVKLTTQDSGPEEALATVCDLYDCSAAAVPDTTEEIDGEELSLGVEVLHPNAGMAEDEVLDRYNRVQTPSGHRQSKLL